MEDADREPRIYSMVYNTIDNIAVIIHFVIMRDRYVEGSARIFSPFF